MGLPGAYGNYNPEKYGLLQDPLLWILLLLVAGYWIFNFLISFIFGLITNRLFIGRKGIIINIIFIVLMNYLLFVNPGYYSVYFEDITIKEILRIYFSVLFIISAHIAGLFIGSKLGTKIFKRKNV